jgi:hypothetical protein
VEPFNATSQMPFDSLTFTRSSAPTVDLLVVITIPGVLEMRDYESWIRVLWESDLSLSANTRKYNGLCKTLTIIIIIIYLCKRTQKRSNKTHT